MTNQLDKSFKELAKKYHPDLNPSDPTSTEKFQNLLNEYKTCEEIINSTPKVYNISVQISLKDSICGCERFFLSKDQKRRFILKVPAGIKNNDIIRYKNIQMEEFRFSILEVKVNVIIPNDFTLINGKLFKTIKVSFWKLYFGGDLIIIGPDKMRLRVEIQPKTKNGSIFEMKNEGLFDKLSKKRDILYIKVKSVFSIF